MSTILDSLINIAKKSTMKHRHGCCLVYRNKIISTGYNYCNKMEKFDDNYINNKYSIHAEKDAIRKIKDTTILNKSVIYVIRISNSNDDISIVEGIPCHHCNKLINKYKIKIKHIINT